MIVTVKQVVPLWKDDVPANNIELLQFNEVDFEVVRQKDLNQVGDKLYLFLPDYNLPDTELFEDYIRPNGDPKKSKLGSKNRIRAVKFNFHRGDGVPVFSNGIVMQFENEGSYHFTYEDFGVYKYVEESVQTNLGEKEMNFPPNLYKTDENNILNVSLEFPRIYNGALKVDGSSITIYSHNNDYGITSRNIRKSLTETVRVGKRKPRWYEKILMFFKYKVILSIYEEQDAINDFVVIGKPYLEKLIKYTATTGKQLALRGELCGIGLKGSGNKHNPHANLEKQILFFGADYYDGKSYRKLSNTEFTELVNDLQLPRCPVIFDRVFENKQELYDECNNYFKTNLVEGIVIRNEGTSVSCKFMNLEYDAKK